MADLDLANFQGFLDYEGLEYYDEKSEARMDAKVLAETDRAKGVENTLNSNKVDKTTVATSSTLGLVKSGTDITVDSSGNVSVNDDSHNHVVSNVDGLQSALDAKAPLASPTFTGTPKAPTATASNNTTQIATTAFVQNAISNKAELDENGIILSSQLPFSITKSETKPTIIGALSDIVYNSNPISGDYVGWVCTPSGWFGFGKIEIASNGIELSDGSAFVLSNGELFLTYDN